MFFPHAVNPPLKWRGVTGDLCIKRNRNGKQPNFLVLFLPTLFYFYFFVSGASTYRISALKRYLFSFCISCSSLYLFLIFLAFLAIVAKRRFCFCPPPRKLEEVEFPFFSPSAHNKTLYKRLHLERRTVRGCDYQQQQQQITTPTIYCCFFLYHV